MEWLLILFMFTLGDEGETNTKSYTLNTLPSEVECLIERDRIMADMVQAYPEDHDFRIDCKPKGEHDV